MNTHATTPIHIDDEDAMSPHRLQWLASAPRITAC